MQLAQKVSQHHLLISFLQFIPSLKEYILHKSLLQFLLHFAISKSLSLAHFSMLTLSLACPDCLPSKLILCLPAKKCTFCSSGVKLTPVMILILELFLLHFFLTFGYLAHNK